MPLFRSSRGGSSSGLASGLRSRVRTWATPPTVITTAFLVALGLTALSEPPARAHRADPQRHSRLTPAPDATELRVLDWALWHASKYYVEPDRIDPKKMAFAGLEALEDSIAEVLVEPLDDQGRVRVRVGTQSREYDLTSLDALWAVGPAVRDVFHFIDDNTDLTDEERRRAEYGIVAGALATLDPHTNLLRPDDFADMKASTKGSFGGLGIEVGMREGAITVIRVIDDNPASTVDMQPGDRIVQIDAESTVTMNLNEAVGRLRGPPGTTVAVYVLRDSLEKPKRLDITRATIKLDSVIGDILTETDASGRERKVGLVQIPRNFAQTTGNELHKKLGEFKQADVEGIILDLRDNPGGLLTAAVEVADAFVSAGTIVSTVGVSPEQEVSRASERVEFPDLPLVVLVDQGSASASEIVAGALRNLGRAVVVGRRTFGKGSVQVLHERKVGDKELALKLTIAHYLTPGDVSIQSVGVSPDLETIPVQIGRENISYFSRGRFDLLREESLASHLEYDSARARLETPFGPLHFLGPRSVSSEDDLSDDPPKKKKKSSKKQPDDGLDARTRILFEDPEIRIARDLVLWAPAPDRAGILAHMDEFVAGQTEAEQGRISESLRVRDIDWSRGPAPAAGTEARLRVQIRSDKPGNVIPGGERGTVTVSVENTGTAPAFQVRGITDSDYRYFDEHELLFGRIDPGQTREYSIKLSVSEHELSRTDRIDVHLFEQYGAKLQSGSQTSIDVSARGLPRPQFAYGFQIVDDPAMSDAIQGNGDGALQVGERVLIRVHVANQGEGPALDTWVTLRNLSGESVFLHTGRAQLKDMQPGDTRIAELDVELRGLPEDSEARMQLTVSDNKIAEVLSEKIVLPVPESGTSLAGPQDRFVVASGDVDLYASPITAAHVLGRAKAAGVFSVSGVVGDWLRIDLGDGQFAFGPRGKFTRSDARPTEPVPVESAYEVSPPRITLASHPTQTADESITIEGLAEDDEALRDTFIIVTNPSRDLFGHGEKVAYSASDDPLAGRLKIEAKVPLTPGNNLIEIHARQNDDVVAIRRMWVLRTSGLAEARAAQEDFASHGQLRVDTFKP